MSFLSIIGAKRAIYLIMSLKENRNFEVFSTKELVKKFHKRHLTTIFGLQFNGLLCLLSLFESIQAFFLAFYSLFVILERIYQ